ncbi:uncharacterized protein PADG_12042 [Paracoccidioides brasiliensis Pb18]|uniref:Uncharacterized protein n=1 Tax=Paracoccidioides brasiliensis (strain Pb18) TaxID=502780 RepID=A0A0A0HWX3_PARBD|nr:uncharacterized protein PADG_12042 [Paracoccidioides brasiliensis Pb18]KGM91900.1 hypothetical protein PADG_12042 [Paracoccidioides brasiliensis Pb18]
MANVKQTRAGGGLKRQTRDSTRRAQGIMRRHGRMPVRRLVTWLHMPEMTPPRHGQLSRRVSWLCHYACIAERSKAGYWYHRHSRDLLCSSKDKDRKDRKDRKGHFCDWNSSHNSCFFERVQGKSRGALGVQNKGNGRKRAIHRGYWL